MTIARWLLLVLLVMGLAWTLNLTAYNYWLAGGPPTPRPEIYLARSQFFLGLSGVLFAGAVAVLILNVRALRRRRNRSTS